MLEAIRQLLPILAGLYFLEGLTWVRRNRSIYVVGLFGGARRSGSGLRLTGFWPPQGVFAPRRPDASPEPPEAFDLEALRQRFDRWQTWSRPTSELALAELAWVFGGLPWLVLRPPPPPYPAIFLATALALHVATAVTAHRLARRLRREGLAFPSTALVGIWIYPPATMRAAAELSRELLADFDDLTLAAVFLGQDAVRRLARPKLATADASRSERTGRWDALRGLLRQVGLPPESVLEAPARRDPTAQAYCPACTEEYVKTGILCEDCGVPVEAYGHDSEKRTGRTAEAGRRRGEGSGRAPGGGSRVDRGSGKPPDAGKRRA